MIALLSILIIGVPVFIIGSVTCLLLEKFGGVNFDEIDYIG